MSLVLDRDQAGDAAVFVHDDGHVVAREPEFLEQHVQALGFRDQHGRAQQFAHAAGAAVTDHAAQQVLGQQDAEDLVAVLAVHREAGVAGLDHQVHQVKELRVDGQGHHLRTRHHDVADLLFGHRQGAFEHLQGVGLDQAVGLGLAKDLDQVLAGFGFAGKGLAQAFKPRAAFRRATRGIFGHFWVQGRQGGGNPSLTGLWEGLQSRSAGIGTDVPPAGAQ